MIHRCRCGLARPGRAPRGACARCPDCGSGISATGVYPEPKPHEIVDGACRLCGLAEPVIVSVAALRKVEPRLVYPVLP